MKSALAAGAIVTFQVNNSTVTADDLIIARHVSGGTAGPYLVSTNTVANGSFRITVRNTGAGSLSEAIVIKFIVMRAPIN
jgi:hypothetical protein